jgi:hypothetical protein
MPISCYSAARWPVTWPLKEIRSRDGTKGPVPTPDFNTLSVLSLLVFKLAPDLTIRICN